MTPEAAAAELEALEAQPRLERWQRQRKVDLRLWVHHQSPQARAQRAADNARLNRFIRNATLELARDMERLEPGSGAEIWRMTNGGRYR
jgi:hypothetical protein